PEVVSAPSQPKVNAPASMGEFADSQPAASSAGSFTALFNTPPSTENATQAAPVGPLSRSAVSPILAESLRAKREGGAFTQLFAPERESDAPPPARES